MASPQRVKIDTASLSGSINQGRSCSMTCSPKQYTETVDPNSPIITLLIPSGALGGYYADAGWRRAIGGTPVVVPDENRRGASRRRADPHHRNAGYLAGQWRLIFRCTISVDSNYSVHRGAVDREYRLGRWQFYPFSRIVRQASRMQNFFRAA